MSDKIMFEISVSFFVKILRNLLLYSLTSTSLVTSITAEAANAETAAVLVELFAYDSREQVHLDQHGDGAQPSSYRPCCKSEWEYCNEP